MTETETVSGNKHSAWKLSEKGDITIAAFPPVLSI
jgi:hypothetical protein